MTASSTTRSLLYISYDGLLEPLGASQVVPYVEGVADDGFEVTLLSFEKPGDGASEAAQKAMAARLGRAGILWTALPYHRTPTLPATAWDVWVGRRFAQQWASAHPGGGILHARGYLAGLMVAGARSRLHPFLFDARGFWVDERIQGGYWAPGSVQVRAGRWVERAAFGAADHLILLSRRGAERVGEVVPSAADTPVTILPTCVDLDAFRPAEDLAARRQELGLDGGPVLVHVGTLTGWYDGEETMAVARAFLERTGGTLVILTRDREAAESLASESGVAARILTVPHDEVPKWLAAADAGMALVRPSPAKDASFPTKIGEYLAAGLAVVATDVGDVAELESPVLRIHRAGATSPEETAAWLARVVEEPERVRRARELARAHLSLEEGIETLRSVYGGLLPADAGGPVVRP